MHSTVDVNPLIRHDCLGKQRFEQHSADAYSHSWSDPLQFELQVHLLKYGLRPDCWDGQASAWDLLPVPEAATQIHPLMARRLMGSPTDLSQRQVAAPWREPPLLVTGQSGSPQVPHPAACRWCLSKKGHLAPVQPVAMHNIQSQSPGSSECSEDVHVCEIAQSTCSPFSAFRAFTDPEECSIEA